MTLSIVVPFEYGHPSYWHDGAEYHGLVLKSSKVVLSRISSKPQGREKMELVCNVVNIHPERLLLFYPWPLSPRIYEEMIGRNNFSLPDQNHSMSKATGFKL